MGRAARNGDFRISFHRPRRTKKMQTKTGARRQLKVRTPSRTKSQLRKRVKTAFTIMPFNPALEPVYLKIIKPILEHARFECNRGDNKSDSIGIMSKVNSMIQDADLIVCDLTGGNPNVYFELG